MERIIDMGRLKLTACPSCGGENIKKVKKAIVRFIDHVDRRIHRCVRTKQKLIKLLEEQKQAIIHHAVTRGLDPNVSLKPSGVEWLGDVPEHWEVRRLRHLIRGIDQGVSPLAEAGLADNDSWGVLKAGCVNGGVFRETEHKRLPSDFRIDPRHIVNAGDVLVSRACGSPQLVGSVGHVDSLSYRLILSDKTFRLNLREKDLTPFLVAAMNTCYFREQVEMAISGAEGLANNLPVSALKDFWLAVPPLSEALSITSHLEGNTQELTSSISRNQAQVELLREYRTRLIADVVTGKLDVREAAARLLDEVEEPNTLNEEDALSNATDEKADVETLAELEE